MIVEGFDKNTKNDILTMAIEDDKDEDIVVENIDFDADGRAVIILSTKQSEYIDILFIPCNHCSPLLLLQNPQNDLNNLSSSCLDKDAITCLKDKVLLFILKQCWSFTCSGPQNS